MSYPALMEKPDAICPTGGGDMLVAIGGGGGLMEETRGGTEGEAEGGKGELLVKGEEREERGGN